MPARLRKAKALTNAERKELEELRTIVATVEEDIEAVYREYFPDEKRPIRIPFASFLELLVVKGKQLARRAVVTAETRKLIERMATDLVNKAVIRQATIPVIIIAYKEGRAIRYRAITIRGAVKNVEGATVEEAYGKARVRIVGLLSERPHKMLLDYKKDWGDRFARAAPFRTEDVLGFKVEARLEPGVS